MTTVPQMVNRAHSHHYRVANAVLTGVPLDGSRWTMGERRGHGRVMETLYNWGVISGGAITDIGREFVAAYKRKFPNA